MAESLPPPPVRLTRIAEIATFEVMEDDLDRLDHLFAEESQALGFASACGGIFVSTALSWVAAGHLGAAAVAVYAATVAVSGVGTAWFGTTWTRARRRRPRLLDRLRPGASLKVVRTER